MKFICTQENLLTGLSSVSSLPGRNLQLPVLQHVLIEVREGVLQLTCTDLEVGARVIVSGKAEKDGAGTVLARQLLEYVQQLPGTEPVTLEIKNKNLFISLRGFKAQFPTAPADDFPLLPVAPSDTLAVVDGHRLGQALDNTIFAAARDESRPEIHSLYLHGETDVLRLAATDSFRLAESIVPLREGNKPFSFLLPISAAQEVRRLFGQRDIVTVLATDNYVVFRDQGLYLSSRLVEGTYPDYRQIIPTAFDCRGEVKREELLRALKILSVFLPRDSRRISLRVQGEQGVVEMRTEGREAGQGEVTMAWQGKGKDVEVFFNITYLLDGATHGRSERVELGFGGSSSPVMFRPVEEAAKNLYIVMPIQV